MIGTNIRGLRHLWRVSDSSLKQVLLKCRDNGEYGICEVIKTPLNSRMGERLYIFNPWYNMTNYSHSTLHNELEKVDKQVALSLASASYPRIIEIKDRNNHEEYFSEITLLPQSFDEDYESFLKENSKMIKSLTERYGVPSSDITYKRMYIYTEGSKNFFQWGINLYFKVNCSMATIYNILLWNDYYKQLAKNLSKGTITAYTTSSEINRLMDELSSLRKEKRINDAISSFNTVQKKILRNNKLSDTDKTTLAKFAKLSEIKRINFIKKVSTIEDFAELMRQMRHATSVHFDWNKESLMDYLNNVEELKYEIVYENEYTVLVKVLDYETIKQLGKTTNWCISKNKTYWNNYIEHTNGKSTQYMIFDFSKLEDDKFSIIGFTTTKNKGITSAHNFTNASLIEEENNNRCVLIKSYLSRFNKKGSIYNILSSCGIDINLVVKYDKPKYEWSHDGFFNYLYECVDKDNIDVIKDEDGKVVVSVRDEGIKYFFGDNYMDNMSEDVCEMQHILFVDFSLNQYDPNKVVFGIINDTDSSEDYCCAMYNEASLSINNIFDAKLSEFDVPYTIIRRADDLARRVRNSFLTYNTNGIKDCLKIDKNCLHETLKNNIYSSEIFEILQTSIQQYLSFDFINLIYDSGHYLSDYLDTITISKILRQTFSNLLCASRSLYRNSVLEKPSDERIKAFYDETIQNREDVKYIGYYCILKYIILHENTPKIDYNRMFTKLVASLYDFKVTGELVKELVYMILNKVDMRAKKDCTYYLVLYLVVYGDDEMLNTAKMLSEKHSWIAPILQLGMDKRKTETKRELAFDLADGGRFDVEMFDDAPF